MSKENVKAFLYRNKGKIIFVAGVSVAVVLAAVGIRRKRSKLRAYDFGFEFVEPIPLKDIVPPQSLDKTNLKFLSKYNITKDTLIVDIAFKIKEPIN